jgi:hypothetical protein
MYRWNSIDCEHARPIQLCHQLLQAASLPELSYLKNEKRIEIIKVYNPLFLPRDSAGFVFISNRTNLFSGAAVIIKSKPNKSKYPDFRDNFGIPAYDQNCFEIK